MNYYYTSTIPALITLAVVIFVVAYKGVPERESKGSDFFRVMVCFSLAISIYGALCKEDVHVAITLLLCFERAWPGSPSKSHSQGEK